MPLTPSAAGAAPWVVAAAHTIATMAETAHTSGNGGGSAAPGGAATAGVTEADQQPGGPHTGQRTGAPGSGRREAAKRNSRGGSGPHGSGSGPHGDNSGPNASAEGSANGSPDGSAKARANGGPDGSAKGSARGGGKRAEEAAKHLPPPLPEPLRVPVADSHTHLDMQQGTVAEALAKAASVGVHTVIQVGCDVAGSRWAAETAAAYENVWAAVALHPNEAPRIVLGDPDGPQTGGRPRPVRPPGGDEALAAALAEIDALAALPQVRGVGETGLDYFRTGPEGMAAQEYSFRRHIDIAKRHGKALVIHDREAHDDVLRVLDEEGAPETVVFHCYSGDAAMARTCAEHGYYLSFAGNVTFKNAQPLRDALAVAPLDRILVETDAPFLTPMPYRGRPNAPYLIPLTLRAMAEVRGVDEETLATAVAANTARAFAY